MAMQGRRLDEATKAKIAKHLREGKSQRQAARAVGVSRSTLQRYKPPSG